MTEPDLSGFRPDHDRDQKAERVRRELGDKFDRTSFPGEEQARKLWRLALDESQSWERRSIAFAALLYFVLIVDLIPDCMPGIGLIDDCAVIAATYLSLISE